EGQFVSVTVRDLSQQREAEKTLRAFEDASRLASIVRSSQDAIIGKSLTGVITSWNNGAEQMYGYDASEMIGHNISELVPADRAGELAPIIERVARGEAVHHFRTQRIAKDGRVLDMSVAISPILDPEGVVTGASTVARDMTEITRAATYRSALEAQLHQAQRLESLGQLAGGVAHDFNNLLSGIMNYASLVDSGLNDEVARLGLSNDDSIAAILGDVAQITAVAKRAANLTRQLLIFSRREVVRPGVLDVNAVVHDMEALIRTTIGPNVHHVTTVLADDLPFVLIDRGQMEQVLMNLAVNARDAMPHGGELTIETSTFDLDESVFRSPQHVVPGRYVQLSVSDTGTGMDREVASRAFEPFFTTKPTGEGTGLGLATVFGIVTQAQGAVTIYSEPGVGTTVRIHIPASPAEPEQPSVASAPRRSLAGVETILLVDDEEMVREPARRLLARFGYSVLDTSNADDALEIVRRHAAPIDLLLTDVAMPGRSGKELSDQLLAVSPATKVLFMSGSSRNVIVRNGVLDDDVNLIEKPFSANDLLRRVRATLDGDG
ncbi:MAG: hypothetical protein QOE00_1533, partial [Ilumatobacteraceae bacterium]